MNYFEQILVPVDFSINTTVAVKKAIELAVPGITNIQLLHVAESKEAAEKKLHSLAKEIGAVYHINSSIHIIQSNKVEFSLIQFAKENNPCMIVLGKNNHHSFFPFLNTIISTNIAEETKCPVLTVKPGAFKKKMETIVMPVSDSFPTRKMNLLTMLNLNFSLTVHLITILNNNQRPDHYSTSALYHSMKYIREKVKCNVQHCLIHSNHKAIATLRYAEKINADILLVSPETESTITTWMSKKDISDVVRLASQLQVLSIQPN
jgi:nucleotide-binding universal stress UspA family protein